MEGSSCVRVISFRSGFIQRHWLPPPESLTLWCFMGDLTSWDWSDFQQETDARVQTWAWRQWDASATACTALTYMLSKAGSLYKCVQTFQACEPWFVEQTGLKTYQTGSRTEIMFCWRRRSNILYAVCSNKSCLILSSFYLSNITVQKSSFLNNCKYFQGPMVPCLECFCAFSHHFQRSRVLFHAIPTPSGQLKVNVNISCFFF